MIFGQLIPVAFVLNFLRVQSYEISIMPWQLHLHVACLNVERIPFEIVNTPPVIGVFLSSYHLVLRSFEHICAICGAPEAHYWCDFLIS